MSFMGLVIWVWGIGLLFLFLIVAIIPQKKDKKMDCDCIIGYEYDGYISFTRESQRCLHNEARINTWFKFCPECGKPIKPKQEQ